MKEEGWGKLVEAYLTLARHVSLRPVMTALKTHPAKSLHKSLIPVRGSRHLAMLEALPNSGS